MAYCSICDKTFKTVQSLASHRYVYHAKRGTQTATKSAQSDIATQLKSPKRLAKQVESTQSDSDTDMERSLTRQVNIHTASSYPRLVKYLCKFLLEGDLPMTKKHSRVLKQDANVIRRIAHGRVAEGQNVIRKQVLLHNKTGDSALGKLLEIAINILQNMF